jgi:hypothetical protein
MKRYLITLFIGLATLSAFAQNITATRPARLEVYAMKMDGSEAVMTSEQFLVFYDQLKMTGELDINTFQTDDQTLGNLLDSAVANIITLSGMVPEGKFAFHDSQNEKFSVEVEMHYGELQSKIIIGYDVSNRNTSLANTFDITCTGSFSLHDDLGITRETGLEDKISFIFFQTVRTKSY